MGEVLLSRHLDCIASEPEFLRSGQVTFDHTHVAAIFALTQRHNKNPGTISYGGGDPGAFVALTVQEPTSIRLAQLRLQHAQVYALDVKSDEATRSPHWPDLLAESMSAD